MLRMAVREHQAVYALHRDTHNCHVHVAVNRVHPTTEIRRGLKVKGIREKFGVLSVYLSKTSTPEVQAILDEAHAAAMVTCEVCGAPGRMADRHGWMSVKCDAHENWSPADCIDERPRRRA